MAKKKKKQPPLTEEDWKRVLALRCRARRERVHLTNEEQLFLNNAYNGDNQRYADMDEDVIKAVPVPWKSRAGRKKRQRPVE